jgi:hypothetical protein
MSCGCNKKNVNEENPAFRKEEIKRENFVTEKANMIQNFASAIASRGISNEKVSIPVKQLRVLSCFGNMKQGGELPPCEHLKPSVTPGKYFCGGCGCGDRKGTWLVSDGDEYSKLDYPKLACPLQMPGFSNYKKSEPAEGESPITRRYYIENNINYKDLEKIPVTVPSPQNKQ